MRYIVIRVRKKDDVPYGLAHASDDFVETACGIMIDDKWVNGKLKFRDIDVTCKKCLKLLKEYWYDKR